MATGTIFTDGEVVFTGFCGDYRSIGTQHNSSGWTDIRWQSTHAQIHVRLNKSGAHIAVVRFLNHIVFSIFVNPNSPIISISLLCLAAVCAFVEHIFSQLMSDKCQVKITP